MLRLQDVSKVYRTDEVETTALDAVNIHIEEGEFVAVMGPSGCGKSTLLNIVGMLDTPDSGSYRFKGRDISRSPESELTGLRKAHLGFIFQSFNLIDELTVEENIALPLIYHGNVPPAERRRRVAEVMERLNISHRARHVPSQLSGGQQQRVAIARALVTRPALILADEPTGNLDSRHGQEIMEMLGALNAAGTTIVMVTHSERDAGFAHRVIHLFDGRVKGESREPRLALAAAP